MTSTSLDSVFVYDLADEREKSYRTIQGDYRGCSSIAILTSTNNFRFIMSRCIAVVKNFYTIIAIIA